MFNSDEEFLHYLQTKSDRLFDSRDKMIVSMMANELAKYVERRRKAYGALPIATGCVALYFAWHLPLHQRMIGLGIYSAVSYLCYEKAVEKTKQSKMKRLLEVAV